MKKRLFFVALGVALAVLFGASVAALAQTAVTECGQTVEGDAYLAGGLDCSDFVGEDPTGAAIILLSSSGRLDLRGFTVTGGARTGNVVSCVKPCNPHHNRCGTYQIRPARCEIFDSVGGGVITGARNGISAESVRVQDVTIRNTRDGAITPTGRVMLRNVILSGSNVGVDTEGSVRIYDSTITGNARFGIVGRRIVLRSSTVTANGLISGCDSHSYQNRCADLYSSRTPRLKDSTCDTSTGQPAGGDPDWGVCSLD